ncbi:MAG: heavy metal-binding domain-containing protein [Actinomycetes bacterium]
MAGWDPSELPPIAAARLARFAESRVSSSLLSVPGSVALEAYGFDAVGEAMGAIVESIGWSGYGGCGYGYGGFGGLAGRFGAGTVTSGQGGFAGYAPYVEALYRGWDTAIHRMLIEARAMGADGVVGVRLDRRDLGESTHEFLALGTAMRARGSIHPTTPFSTELSGPDVAVALAAGWVPVTIAMGITVAIRHDDYQTQTQASSMWSGNTEVSGYTELVTYARDDARRQFTHRAARAGAEALLVSRHSLEIHEVEPAENHRDHIAEAMFTGTAMARFHQGAVAPTSTLTILPLTRASDRRIRL